jgi:hypothetical protein
MCLKPGIVGLGVDLGVRHRKVKEKLVRRDELNKI